MKDDRIQALARQMMNAVPGTPDAARCSAGVLVLPAILRILVKGHPAAQAEIGEAIGLPAHLAATVIPYVFPDAELDPDGRLVGLGLSLVPTDHHVRLPGRDLDVYAWCAQDALSLPMLLGEGAQITSSCPATGHEVTVIVGPASVEDVGPTSAVVALKSTADPQHLRASGCDNQPFFASADAAGPWLAKRPGTVTVPVVDAFQALSRTWHPLLDATTEGPVDTAEFVARMVPHGEHAEEIPCRLIAKPGDAFTTESGQPELGDMWWDPDFAGWLDSQSHRERGGGPHLVVRLPNGWDWDIDGPMSNGEGWWRTGEPPHTTALPSILAEDYHGLLIKGKLIQAG